MAVNEFFEEMILKYEIKNLIDVLDLEITRKVSYDVFLVITKENNVGLNSPPDEDLVTLHSQASLQMHHFFEYAKQKFNHAKQVTYQDNFKREGLVK